MDLHTLGPDLWMDPLKCAILLLHQHIIASTHMQTGPAHPMIVQQHWVTTLLWIVIL